MIPAWIDPAGNAAVTGWDGAVLTITNAPCHPAFAWDLTLRLRPGAPSFTLRVVPKPFVPHPNYPDGHDPAAALARMLHGRDADGGWRPLTARQDGRDAVLTVPAGLRAVALGLPWLAADHAAVLDGIRSRPELVLTPRGRAAHGAALHTVRTGARPGDGAYAGSFLIIAGQHHSEWAGMRAVAALLHWLVETGDGPDARRRFAWHVVPCANPDPLADPGRDDPGNLNRDWGAWTRPESRAIRDAWLEAAGGGEHLLHALDLHMGWSRPDDDGACISTYDPTTGLHGWIARQSAMAHAVQAAAGMPRRLWPVDRPENTSFSDWCGGAWGAHAQTIEFSRIAWPDGHGGWTPPTPDREAAVGTAIGRVLSAWDWLACPLAGPLHP
jgi:hypothetical protein